MEFVELKELVIVKRGGDWLGKKVLEDEPSLNNYPVYNGGLNPLGYWKEFNTPANSMVVYLSADLAGLIKWFDFAFYANSDCCRLLPNSNKVIYKYLFYFLHSKQMEIFRMQYGVRIKHFPLETFLKIKVPLPPLNQQQKIAHLLTNFENAIKRFVTLLEREKELRQKQYNFYLKNSFKNISKNFPYVNFLDIGDLLRGKPVNSKLLDKESKLNQNFPFINGGFKPSGYWKEWNIDFETITISTGGSVGFTNYWNKKIWVGSDCLYFVPQNQNFLLKYIYYFLKFKKDVLSRAKKGGAICHLEKNIFNSFKVPLLPLNQQKTVTKNLTILETSTEKMKVDITTEIELRKQQYKHYLNTIFQHLI